MQAPEPNHATQAPPALHNDRPGGLGLAPLVAELFAPGTPLALIAAQGLYLAQPLIAGMVPPADLHALALRLEALDRPPDPEVGR